MIAAGYTGALGLFSAAGILARQSIQMSSDAEKFESALTTPLPVEKDKTAFVSLKYLGNPVLFAFFPEDRSVLLGRVCIVKHKTHWEVSLGGNGIGSYSFFPVVKKAKIEWELPAIPVIESPSGPIYLHHLNEAHWEGSEKREYSYKMDSAEAPLEAMGIKPDAGADGYKITVDVYTKAPLYIFGEVRKSDQCYHLLPPSPEFPTLVTSEDPKEFVPQLHATAEQTKWRASSCLLGAASMSSGARVLQLFMKSFDPSLVVQKRPALNGQSIFYAPKQMIAFSGMSAVAAMASLQLWFFPPASTPNQKFS